MIEAPPGAGKSTRVPPALLDAGLAGDQTVLLLEPRRVAARAVATRIAEERGARPGREVGWQVRFDRRATASTRLLVITEGILTRRIQSDPFLEGVGLLVLDEFHERSIHTDLALGFAKELLEVRDDLRLVVMSATLAAQEIAGFLSCPTVRSEGRLHPIDVRYVDRDPDDLGRAVRDGVRQLVDAPDDDGGDILVFLPGMAEIAACLGTLQSFSDRLDVLRLHGSLPEAEQDRALRKGPRRRVVLSTNIAETSLTIDGVTAVIDSGLVRTALADPATGFDRLDTGRISLASAAQRAGRAGRVAPGRVLRLWPRASEFRMSDYDIPEVQRIDLSGAILDVVSWSGRSPREFPWFDPPPEAALLTAVSTLRALGTIGPEDWTVTAVGRRVAELPLHPRIARFLLAAEDLGAGRIAAKMAANLSEPDWVTAVSDGSPSTRSDALVRAELLDEVAAGRTGSAAALGLSVSVGGARNAQRVARELTRFVQTEGADTALRALLTAYADRICLRRSKERFAVSSGGSVVLGRESTVRESDLVLALTIFGTRYVDGVECGIVRQASAIEWKWLEEELPERFTDQVQVSFDDKLKRIVARRRRTFDTLLLDERSASLSDASISEEVVARALAEATALALADAFALNRDAQQFLERVEFLRHWMPELELPNPRDPELLTQICWGKTSWSELSRLGFLNAYRPYLRHDQVTAIDREAPERITLPSGRRFRVDYSDLERPVLAAKLQDFFGMHETPTIAGGRVALLLHLLAPNQRPAQITQDLKSFWTNTYPEVRKELRARYPKHDWPEEPN